MNIRVLSIASAALLALAAPVQVAAQPASPQVAAAPDQDYILGPQDVVEVDVLGQADFKVRAPVGTDGSITLPYIGKVTAANKTTTTLANDVSRALEAGGYYSHPILSIQIVAYASRYVIVLGDVGAPGLLPVDRSYHLSEILARVGGTKPTAADYLVVRTAQGAEHRYLISDLATGDDAQDPLVAPGDKIFSPAATTFYISGQVKAPGSYPETTGMTLRMAIARAGGLTDLGTERGVKVHDRAGKSLALGLDDSIGPEAVIVVGERLF